PSLVGGAGSHDASGSADALHLLARASTTLRRSSKRVNAVRPLVRWTVPPEGSQVGSGRGDPSLADAPGRGGRAAAPPGPRRSPAADSRHVVRGETRRLVLIARLVTRHELHRHAVRRHERPMDPDGLESLGAGPVDGLLGGLL